MKKTLLSMLLLVASAIMAQAQGFRVIKSDGTVYQFSWVADRIEFYEGDGDPNWVEPIPDEVREAIATLQSACATNAAKINQIQANLDENKAAVMNVVKDLADINEQLSGRIKALALHVTENTGMIERNTTNIDRNTTKIDRNTADIATIGEQVGWCQYTVGEHDVVIKDHQVTIESLLNQCRTLNDKITTIEDVIASLEQNINQDFNNIQKQIDELNGSLFATIQSQQEQFQSLQLENQNQQEQIHSLQLENQSQQEQIDALNARVAQLQLLINQLRNQ